MTEAEEIAMLQAKLEAAEGRIVQMRGILQVPLDSLEETIARALAASEQPALSPSQTTEPSPTGVTLAEVLARGETASCPDCGEYLAMGHDPQCLRVQPSPTRAGAEEGKPVVQDEGTRKEEDGSLSDPWGLADELAEALGTAANDLLFAAARLRALGHGQSADTTDERAAVAQAALALAQHPEHKQAG